MEPETPRSRKQVVLALVVTLAAALLVVSRLVTVCAVVGRSMEPGFEPGDRLLVERGVREVHRGDVVVFRNPLASKELLVKRVIALPGETVQGRGATLFVDGAALAEPYAKSGAGVGEVPPNRVPQDHYFVVGDNRSESIDSRQFDAVGRDLLVGKVLARVWPWGSRP